MNSKIAIALALLSANANAELRTWEVAGTVGFVSGPNLPLPANVGDDYSFGFTFDSDAVPLDLGDGCAQYPNAVKALAVRVGENMIANTIIDGFLTICNNSAVYGDSIAFVVSGAFDVQVNMETHGKRGPLKTNAIPRSPPKLPNRISILLGAPVLGVQDYFSAPIKTVTDLSQRQREDPSARP